MRAVEVTDINQTIDDYISVLDNDPVTKQSKDALEVARYCIEVLEELKSSIESKAQVLRR